MILDIGEITEENVDEWWARLRIMQPFGGGKLANDEGEFFITREDIANHIGMVTNVTTRKRSVWLNRQFGTGTGNLLPKFTQEKSAHTICAERAAKIPA